MRLRICRAWPDCAAADHADARHTNAHACGRGSKGIEEASSKPNCTPAATLYLHLASRCMFLHCTMIVSRTVWLWAHSQLILHVGAVHACLTECPCMRSAQRPKVQTSTCTTYRIRHDTVPCGRCWLCKSSKADTTQEQHPPGLALHARVAWAAVLPGPWWIESLAGWAHVQAAESNAEAAIRGLRRPQLHAHVICIC